MRNFAIATVLTSLVAVYAVTGTLGVLVSPWCASSGSELAVLGGGALVVIAGPTILGTRAIRTRKPHRSRTSIFAPLLVAWSVALAAGAAAAPGRGERFAWPARSLAATIAPSPSPSPSPLPSSAPLPATPRPSSSAPALSRGTAQVELRLEGLPHVDGAPPPAPVALRYVAAWPEPNGIAVALADRPVRCPGIHESAGVILTPILAPDLDGGFHAGREVAVAHRVQPFRSESPGGVFVTLDRFEVKAGAPIHGRLRVDLDIGTPKHLVGGGTFDAILCATRHDGPAGRPGDPHVDDFVERWRAPAPSDADLGGSLLGQTFAPRRVVAWTRAGRDGKPQLTRLSFTESGVGCGPPSRGEPSFGIEMVGLVGGPTAGSVPSRARGDRPGAGPNSSVDAESMVGVVAIDRFDEVVEGRATAWAAARKTERTTEVSGRFRAQVCPEPM